MYTIYSMWLIYEHNRVSKSLKYAPLDIQKRYEKWKDIVSISGPKGLKLIKGFHDEALTGERKGYRSSRLNIQYRVIFKVDADRIFVQVEDVTPHDYRTK